MFPDLGLSTSEISKKLGRGKHTTRHVELFKMPSGGYIAVREFDNYVSDCRFPDCSHTCEKDCAVIEAVNKGLISASRHENYKAMYEEAKQLKEWEYK